MSEQGTSKEWMRRWTDLQLAQESTQSIAATTLVCELVAEVERLSRAGEPAAERALRNCLFLSMSRLHRRSVSGVEKLDWEHILRFCKEGGVEPSPSRAAQPPGDSIVALMSAWSEIQDMIVPGRLPGDGTDQTAQRNGIILAANKLREIIDRATQPPGDGQ